MGCGSSQNATDRVAQISVHDEALFSHLARVLQIAKDEPVIKQYAAALRAEGCDNPDEFDDLTLDELKEEPFSFKRLHLKKVAKSRGQGSASAGPPAAAAAPPPPPSPAAADQAGRDNNKAGVRGQCIICGLDVLDTQRRLKDPETDLYQHQDCQKTRAGAAVVATAPSTTSSAGVPAAADAARAEVMAEAKREAAAVLSQAKADAAQIKAAAIADSAYAEPTATTEPDVIGRGTLLGDPSLPTGPNAKPLLPGGKHAFLSYQWDVQEQVKEMKELLNARQIKCTEVIFKISRTLAGRGNPPFWVPLSKTPFAAIPNVC